MLEIDQLAKIKVIGVCKELTIKYGEKDARFEQVVGKYAIA